MGGAGSGINPLYNDGVHCGADDRVLNRYLQIYSDDDKGLLEVFRCPGDKPDKGAFVEGVWLLNHSFFDAVGTSYRANLWATPVGETSWNSGGENLIGRTLSSIITPPSKMLLVTEGGILYFHGGRRPNAKANVLFLDGHVALTNFDSDWAIGGGDKVYIKYDGSQ